ncbi:MAG: Ig-like domain-containing protein [Labilithrix sp.]|nr:Ig-like domain-containing protein [Labilithrix sp.]
MRRSFQLVVVVLSVVIGLVLASCAEPQKPAIDVTPGTITLVSGQTVQLAVTRRFAGGPVEHVSERVTYSSSNRNVATVSSTGVVTAGGEPGSVVLRVTDLANDATGTATLTVALPRIEAIDIVPSPAVVLRPGASVRFTANARMNDGATRDVTSQVLWASSNVAAATVSLTPTDIGLVTAIASGETTITATDSATLVQGRTIVFVSGEAAQLTALVVTPNPITVTLGEKVQFTARGVFGDGSTKDVTNDVTWTSSDDALLTIDASGLATTVAAGDVTVTAAGTNASGAPVRGSAAVTVQ